MFERYKIIKINSEDVLLLFIDERKFKEEFSIFSRIFKRNRQKKLEKEAEDYIKKNKIVYSGKKISFVIGGVILGSMLFTSCSSPKKNSTPSDNASKNNNQIAANEIIQSDDVNEDINDDIDNVTINFSDISSDNITSSLPPTTVIEAPISDVEISTPVETEKTITVSLKRSTGVNEIIELDEYLIGVVSTEMSPSFSLEALKAQAVAARTYALKRQGTTLVDTTVNQAYRDNTQLKKDWGSNFDKYYKKVKQAVSETKGMVIKYNGQYIDALYHATNNGKTEDPKYVWGNSLPYLKSVASPWDLNANTYNKTMTKTLANFNSILKTNITSQIEIQILTRTANGSINTIKIGSKTFTGNSVKSKLGMISTDFEITINGSNVVIKTKGFGHGVGMSQNGANFMAQEGKSYLEILNHYYSGVSIQNII